MKAAGKTWLFFITVILAPILVFGVVKWYENTFSPLPVMGPGDHRVKNFRFTNQDGKTITAENWKKKVVVANFFFTHCPVVCPKMVYQLKRVAAYAGEDVAIASFSVDPERDSVLRLHEYSIKHGIKGNWNLLTGKKIELYRFARKELMIVATDGDGGPEDFIHSENLVLIDKQKRIRGYYKGTDRTEVDRLIADIKKL